MRTLRREKSYDRKRLLQHAAKALRRGRRGKALQLYERVLMNEPRNVDLQRRAAPLMVSAGRPQDALVCYQTAAEAFAKRGFLDHAVGVYREAAPRLPRHREVWERLAEFEVQRDRRTDAQLALLEGAGHFGRRGERSDAVRLLRRAYEIDPRHVESGLALARALARIGNRRGALAVLAQMERWARGRARRRVRARQLLVAPGPGTAWRWVAALFGG